MIDHRWVLCRRIGHVELRRHRAGEDLTGVSISPEDDPESNDGYIARNPSNPDDQWFISENYAVANYWGLPRE